MEKKYFSFLIIFLAMVIFSGCAGLNRQATVTMISAPAAPVTAVFEKSVEIEISTETEQFTEEDENILRCLTIAGLQERGLQTPVSEDEAAECNALIESKGDVRYSWKKMGFTRFKCEPQTPPADFKPLLLEIRVLDVKKNNPAANFLFGILAGRPEVVAEISTGDLKVEIKASAPISGRGVNAAIVMPRLNTPNQAFGELAKKILETIINKL